MKESDIRPQEIFEEYLRLASEDAVTFFSDVDAIQIACPACASDGKISFVKNGFSYDLCQVCQTLFVNPRPAAECFFDYYKQSASSKFWATTFYKETADARREMLWKPKAKTILEILDKYSAAHHTIVDIGGGYGLFADVIRDLSGKLPVVIEPSPGMSAVCRDQSLPVVEKFLEHVEASDLPIGPKAFVSFELFEHLHNPPEFLSQLKDLMGSGDIFIFTTLSGTGVDIQALWENSKSVSPPHHLNFLNPRAIGILLSRIGLEPLAITTPGRLDIDILSNNYGLIKDRFWRTFIESANDKDKEVWQRIISETGMSSHMMVVCRKN